MKSKSAADPDLSRRAFLRRACCAGVGATGVLSSMAQLRAIGAAAGDGLRTASRTTGGYKALVCLYLQGGNDANSLIIPSDAVSYPQYAQNRAELAIPQDQLLPIAPASYRDGRAYGLHPSVPEMQALFAGGKLGFLANVGTLVQPTTLADYTAGQGIPPQLFSHLDQTLQWQSSVPDQPFTTGWGGRLADIVNAFNSNNQISMSISLNGANSFEVGGTVAQLAVSPEGPQTLGFASSDSTVGVWNARIYPFNTMLGSAQSNLLSAAFGGVTAKANGDGGVLSTALGSAPTLSTAFPSSPIGSQLQMAARLISVAPALGLQRQIFFLQLNGFDLHAGQVDGHGPLLAELSAGLNAFYNATVEMGLQNQITTFTASDFGRTYIPNADGTDHGWGNHQIVMGGTVQGGDIYGQMPSLTPGGADDTGRGRWIPSTSVDEYSATLARWFGVSATNLPVVLPNIGRFAHPNLGFLG